MPRTLFSHHLALATLEGVKSSSFAVTIDVTWSDALTAACPPSPAHPRPLVGASWPHLDWNHHKGG